MCPVPRFACNICQYYRGVEQKFADEDHEQRRLISPMGRPNKTGIDWTNPNKTHAECMRELRALRKQARERAQPPRIRISDSRPLLLVYQRVHAALRGLCKRRGLPKTSVRIFDVRQYVASRAGEIKFAGWRIPDILEGQTKAGNAFWVKLPKRRASSVTGSSKQPVHAISTYAKLRNRGKA